MAKLNYGVSPISVVLRVKLLNSSVTTGAGLAGLTYSSSGLIISTIKIAEATPTVYTAAGSTIETITTLGTYAAPTATKCRFKEIDATNHPGLYEIQFADARFATTDSLIVSISGATNLAQCDIEMQCSNLSSNLIQIAGAAISTTTAQIGTNVVSQANIDFGALQKTSLNAATPASVQNIPATGSGFTAIGDTRIANLDATVSTRATPAQVNAEVVDVLNTDVNTELTAIPTTVSPLRQMIQFLFQYFRNKKTVSATIETMFKEDASTTLGTATLADNGTTFTKGKTS